MNPETKTKTFGWDTPPISARRTRGGPDDSDGADALPGPPRPSRILIEKDNSGAQPTPRGATDGIFASTTGENQETSTETNNNETSTETSRSAPGAEVVPGMEEDNDDEPLAIAARVVNPDQDRAKDQEEIKRLRQQNRMLRASVRFQNVSTGTTTTTTMAVPSTSSSDSPPLKLGIDEIQALLRQGFPIGLVQELGRSKLFYPQRFWLLDNSDSMWTADGTQIRETKNEKIAVVPCTRWAELQGAVEYHAELAGLLEASTVFCMLNDPGAHNIPQEFSVASTADSTLINTEVDRVEDIMRNSEPRGVTPLTAHVLQIRDRIQSIVPILQEKGQRAVVVIATDGLPSNEYGESNMSVLNEFVQALKSLQRLPVWVVIRLCTNQAQVRDYYNQLDKRLEYPLEVLDDFFGEAKEIYAVNKWLNYALPLHRCREMGHHNRMFDLFDERSLTKDELLKFLHFLFGNERFQDAPDIHADWAGFAKVLNQIVKEQGNQFNPITRKLGPWIDMKALNKAYGDKGRSRIFGRRNK